MFNGLSRAKSRICPSQDVRKFSYGLYNETQHPQIRGPHLIRPILLGRGNQNVPEPLHPTPNRETLLLALTLEQFPPPRIGIVVRQTPPTRDSQQSPVRGAAHVSYGPVRGDILRWDLFHTVLYSLFTSPSPREERVRGTNLDMLPDIRLRVDNAHVGLIGSPVSKQSIVQLKESVLGVIG